MTSSVAEAVDRVLDQFAARWKAAQTQAERQAVMLDVHGAVGRHFAEQEWLALITSGQHTDEDRADGTCRRHLQSRLEAFLPTIEKLHSAHGLFDPVFNQASRERLSSAFYERVGDLALSSVAMRDISGSA